MRVILRATPEGSPPVGFPLFRPVCALGTFPLGGKAYCLPLFAPCQGTGQCSVSGQSRVAASGSGCRGHGAEPRAGFWVLLGGPKVPPRAAVLRMRIGRSGGIRFARNVRKTTPPSACGSHLPLHRGGFGTVLRMTGNAPEGQGTEELSLFYANLPNCLDFFRRKR